ncbi:MAG: putative transport system permease protein [Actinomycetota bacterium]
MQGAWAWARAEIRGRWRGLVLVGLLIGVMAGASLVTLAGARRTASTYERFRDRSLAHDAAVFGPDAEVLRSVSRLPEVTASSIGTIFPAFVDFESEFDLGVLVPYDANLGRTVDAGRSLGGRRPDPKRADEVALNPQAADLLKAGPGDRIRLSTITPGQRELIDADENPGEPAGPVLQLRVTGVFRNADDLRADLASHLIYATPAFRAAYADKMGSFIDFAALRLRNGEDSNAAFSAKARPLIGTEGEVSVTGSAELSASMHDALRVLSVGLVVLGLASLLVGTVAGGQALGRQLWLGAPDQVALGALGLTARSRAAAVALTAVPVAALAAVVALVVAVVASPLMPISIGRQAEPDPGVAFDLFVHLGGSLAVGLLVLATAALVGWQVATRHDVTPLSRARPSVATRVANAVAGGPAVTTGVRMALERGTGRSVLPVRSALFAALVAVGGLAATVTFNASLERLTSTPARYGAPWDLQPDAADLGPEEVAKLGDAKDVGILQRTNVVFADGAGATGYAVLVKKGQPQLTITEGRAPFTEDEVALGADQLERLREPVGGTVELRTGDGTRRLRVVGEAVVPAADQDPVAGGVVMTPELLEQVAQSEPSTNAILSWRDDVDPGAAVARFKRSFPGAYSAYALARPPGEVVNLGRVGSLPDAFAAFLAVVGVAGLLHALVTSTTRRRADLAVLRAMGFVRRQLGASVAWQSTTIAVVGLLVGIPLGIAIGRWVWILVADGIGVATDPLVPLTTVLLVPAALLVANLLAVPLGVRAARVPPAAVLRTE